MTSKSIKIGIDTGVNTGLAIMLWGDLTRVETTSITKAMALILQWCPSEETKIYIEDARKWNGYSKNITDKKSKSKAQGAGSVKRDAQIWEDWCKENGYEYLLLSPAAKGAKVDAEKFEKITGWQGRTSQHARDAAMLVYGR